MTSPKGSTAERPRGDTRSMSLLLENLPRERSSVVAPLSRLERSRLRRELAQRDIRSARLAELCAVRVALARAVELVERGWLQHAWYSYRAVNGRVRVSYVADRGRVAGGTVLATCLVAALSESGPTGGQVLGRTVEVTWHALHGVPGDPVRWCPGPDVRAAHARDLTSWNDRPGRTSVEVASLLWTSIGAVDAERVRVAAT